MSASSLKRCLLLLAGSWLICGYGIWMQPSRAEDSAADKADVLTEAISTYELHLGKPSKEIRREDKPILQWTNPVRDTPGGAVFLWTAHGRPQAISCIYTYGEKNIDHEFQSLTDEPLLVIRDGKTVWAPGQPGIEERAFEEAPMPAETPRVRLSQMRRWLARQFTAAVRKDDDRHELRLLPQPIFRYGDKDEGVRDGGLFAFVQATDPEVLLLIEAREVKAGVKWHYALARMSDQQLEVRLNDRAVWSVENWDWRKRQPDQTYIKFTMTIDQ